MTPTPALFEAPRRDRANYEPEWPPILIVPGLYNSGPDHWQSHWERELPNAQRVEQQETVLPAALFAAAGIKQCHVGPGIARGQCQWRLPRMFGYALPAHG